MRTRPESGAESRIRVLTYNVLLGGERREERIAGVLAAPAGQLARVFAAYAKAGEEGEAEAA